ncbi:MAG: phosphoribosyltransferase [Candidatus Dojkabacteria bacterium]
MKNYIEFSQIKAAIAEYEKLEELKQFEKVIAVTRGGLVVAGVLSQHLETRWYDAACVKSYRGADDQGELEIIRANPTEERVLLVEDVVDTGETIQSLKKIYPNSAVFALHVKKDKSKFIPDFYLWEAAADEWLVYPWELE